MQNMGRECSAYVLLMFCACSFHGNSMNNLLSYCRLVDARISASEKDLPVAAEYHEDEIYLSAYNESLDQLQIFFHKKYFEQECILEVIYL